LNQILVPPAPSPRKTPLHLLALLAALRNNPLEVWTEKHFEEPVVRDGLPFMPALVVSEPTAIRHVLLENSANYRKDDLLLRILSPGLGSGLLTVEGDQWRRQRHAVAPIFARRTIFAAAAEMQRAVDNLIGKWRETIDTEAVDAVRDVTHLTLEVLQRTVFSTGIERDPEEFREAMKVYFDTIGRIDPLDALALPSFLPRPSRWPERAALKFFRGAVNDIIERRRALIARSPDAAPQDLLTLLLAAGDGEPGARLSDEEIRANVLTFIAAGHETTATSLAWSLFLLAQSDEWSTLIAEEADRAAGNVDGDDPCAKLPVTRAVLEEALRLYPPIAAISRVAIDNDEIAGVHVERGTMVIVSPYVVHRHRKLWERPSEFDPRRFLGDGRAAIDRYAYIPFGGGSRVCIGSAFALQEATLALAGILRAFRLRLAESCKVEPLLRITLKPNPGIWLHLERRI